MSGVTKTTALTPKQILAFTEPQVSVPAIFSNLGLEADANGKKIIKAGTPITGNLENRSIAMTLAATSGAAVKGVYTIQMTTKAATDDVITIEGINYTCAAEENVENKVFAGADVAAQITSLLKMVVCDDFTVAAVAGATDKIGFTQKIAATGNEPLVSVVKAAAGTLVVGNVTTVTVAVEGSSVSNAIGVALHDVDVTAGNENGTLLITGYVNPSKLETATQNLITAEVRAALKGNITFVI